MNDELTLFLIVAYMESGYRLAEMRNYGSYYQSVIDEHRNARQELIQYLYNYYPNTLSNLQTRGYLNGD